MQLMLLWWRRARLVCAAALLIVAEALHERGDLILSALERETGLDKPAKPFRWADYQPPPNGGAK